MADIVEAPYEITIRFNWDIGEKADEVRGVHLATQTLTVDASGIITGRVIRGDADKPKEFSVDQLKATLGEKFAPIAAQLARLQESAMERKDMELRIARNQWDEETAQLRADNKRLAEAAIELKNANAELEKRAPKEFLPQP